jgi:hypothetical protein
MDLYSYLLEEDFEEFCRVAYESVSVAMDDLGIISNIDYEGFKERYYLHLETEYLKSIENLTIH